MEKRNENEKTKVREGAVIIALIPTKREENRPDFFTIA